MPLFDRDLPIQLGPYTVRARLGHGGMAEAFLADSGDPARPVVVKRALPHHATGPRVQQMLLREGRVGVRLVHENIVRYLDTGTDDGNAWVAMEYLPGLSASAFARRHWQALVEPIPVPVVAQIALDTARGLHYAHTFVEDGAPSPIVHRDISPDNLMVSHEGRTKVLDFGIVRAEGEEQLTRTGEIKGKIGFFPPELLEGEAVDARGDIFSLGVTLYWLLTEQRPFSGRHEAAILKSLLTETPQPVRALRDDVPEALDTLIQEMLAKAPAARVQTAADVEARIAAAVDLDEVPAQVATLCKRLLVLETPEVTNPGAAPMSSEEIASTAVRIQVLETLDVNAGSVTVELPPIVTASRGGPRPLVLGDRAAAYLASLPAAENSYSVAQCKGSLIRNGLADRDDVTALREALPEPLRYMIDRPPASSMWVPEAHHVGLLLAMCEIDGGDERFLQRVHRSNLTLLSSPLYRTLLKLVSPRRGFRFCARTWAQMHRGTTIAIVDEEKGRVSGVLEAPAGLFPRLVCSAFGQAFRAALEVGGAEDVSAELSEFDAGRARYEIRWAT